MSKETKTVEVRETVYSIPQPIGERTVKKKEVSYICDFCKTHLTDKPKSCSRCGKDSCGKCEGGKLKKYYDPYDYSDYPSYHGYLCPECTALMSRFYDGKAEIENRYDELAYAEIEELKKELGI